MNEPRKRKPRTPKDEIEKQHFSLTKVHPLTKNQERTFEEYNKGQHLILSGSAGTGKTFIGMYLAFTELVKEKSCYNKIIIIRSAVPSRDLGFVPGTLEEKAKIYTEPYIQIVNELFGRGDSWHILKNNKEIIEFQTTSFLRGLTFSNCIILLGEFQSATFHEIDSVLTRVGENCKFILCGDYKQNDLEIRREKMDFMK